MRNKIIIFLIMLIPTLSYSQDRDEKVKDSIYVKEFTCDFGLQKAISDFEKGSYNWYIFGLGSNIEHWTGFYRKYLFENYGIKIIDAGCVIMEDDKCYMNKMSELIYKKFGSDIFEKSEKEARKIYTKSK